MQNPQHNSAEDKFAMNFGNFDPDNLFGSHLGAAHMGGMGIGMKRSAHDAGLDREHLGLSSDDDDLMLKKDDKLSGTSSDRDGMLHHQQTSLDQSNKQNLLPNGKKTKGRVKIKMEFIDNKLRRYTTFSKRKTGIMKKAYELSTLTGTQVMLLVASETGHVYTFATRKLQPMITSEAGKALIQTCLNSPDPPPVTQHQHDQRMSATGYEETELTYAVAEDEHKLGGLPEDYLAGGSSSASDSSSPPTPSSTPTPTAESILAQVGAVTPNVTQGLPLQLPSGLVLTPTLPGGSVMLSGGGGGGLVYTAGGGIVYATSHNSLTDGTAPLLLNLPPGLQLAAHDQSSLSCRSPNNLIDKNGLPMFVTGGNNNQGTTHLLPLPITLASAALQQSAAAAVVSAASAAVAAAAAAAEAGNSNNNHDTLPTDLSMHIKRENRS